MKEKTLFEGLNDAQKKAVKETNGASLVIAGAGAGKTRVLTFRIAYLLSLGVPPSNILALTFTNKAANEMKERINHLLGSDIARYLWMGTFHSMFARILRMECESLGFNSSYSIYDTIDSKSLLKSIIRELNLDEKEYKPGEVLARISSAKNNLLTAKAYSSNENIRNQDKYTRRSMMAEIYKLYANRCKKADAMDFDDLLLFTNILFRDQPEILKKYQEKFNYILVDEYQDTNYSQYLIVKKLAEKHGNVCVVGDDAQSIYSFRGAQIENILNFKNDYPTYHLYKLEQNYRSTKTIVNAANSVIAKNKEQIHKKVWSDNEEGQRIKVIKTLTDNEEGFHVANNILDEILQHQLLYSDFAIMYRTNAQSRIFEDSLRKRNIPYKVYGSISFYQRKEIKDLIAYLKLVVNPDDDEALKRIINYPARGIGKTTLGKMEDRANEKDISLWKIITTLNEDTLGLNKGTIGRIHDFVSIIEEQQTKKTTLDAYDLAFAMASKSGILKDLYNGNTPEERSKYENLEELLNAIRDFVDSGNDNDEMITIDKYLENVSLLTDTDKEKEEDKNKVSIMTVHSAKGLEFSNVYIAGAEEELFPSRMSMDTMRELEEERRLFYVALTRAKKKVVITYTQQRYKWGMPTDCEPSRFIKDIDEQYIEWNEDPRKWNREEQDEITKLFGKPEYQRENPIFRKPVLKNTHHQKVVASDPNFKPDEPSLIQAGMNVEHQRFGTGKVIHVEGEEPNRKATVFFQQIKQEKQLLLKFAKLRIQKKYS